MVRMFRHAARLACVGLGSVCLSGLFLLVTPGSAVADTVVDGCTVISNPTPTNRTYCPGADLAGANLAGDNLAFANFGQANLSGADLRGDQLEDANFAGAALTNADLSAASIAGITLDNASAEGIDLRGVTTGPEAFIQAISADLQNADMSDASIGSDAVFNLSNLTGADLHDADFAVNAPPVSYWQGQFYPFQLVAQGANFTDANLSGADLQGAYLGPFPYPYDRATTFAGAILTGTNFTFTVLTPMVEAFAQSSAGAFVSAVQGSLAGAAAQGCSLGPALYGLGLYYGTCTIEDQSGDVAMGTEAIDVVAAHSDIVANTLVASSVSTNPIVVQPPSATLYRFDANYAKYPVAGQVLTFTSQGETLCQATTDASGTAQCDLATLAPAVVLSLVNGYYTVSFAGTSWLEPDTTTGSDVTIDGTTPCILVNDTYVGVPPCPVGQSPPPM